MCEEDRNEILFELYMMYFLKAAEFSASIKTVIYTGYHALSLYAWFFQLEHSLAGLTHSLMSHVCGSREA